MNRRKEKNTDELGEEEEGQVVTPEEICAVVRTNKALYSCRRQITKAPTGAY